MSTDRKGPAHQAGREALEAVKAKRDYVLPYHELLAETDPALLTAYDAFYEKLTLEPRTLSEAEKETVWASLLVATREGAGTLHMRRAVRAGLDTQMLSSACALAGLAEGYAAIDFGADAFDEWMPGTVSEPIYLAMFDAARGAIEPKLAHLAMIVSHAALKQEAGLALHLRLGFGLGLSREAVSEGLSYLLLPCGGPTFIDAVEGWGRAAAEGLCPAPY